MIDSIGRLSSRVEDNPVNARVARLLLDGPGYAADWAVTGRKTVDGFAQHNYDLVLMDLQMPEMDGWRRRERF